jgi:hypothetical protein
LVEVPPINNDDGCSCSDARSESAPVELMFFVAILGLALFRRRLGLFLGLLVSFASFDAQAKSGAYQNSTRTEAYVARTGTTLAFPSDDDDQATLTLPFAFRFFDQDFTTVELGTNGFVTFGTEGYDNGNELLPSINEPDNMIALFWDDWDSVLSTTWVVEGTAPNRIVIIQYSVGTRYNQTGGGTPNVQLWLYEGPGARFEIHYGAMSGMTAASVWNATVGYQDETGTGFNLQTCSPLCDGDDFNALTGTVLVSQQDGGEDVIAGSLEVPVEIYAGVPFNATVGLVSPHGAPLGPFVYQIHLLLGGETVPNRPIYTSAPVTLQPYQTLTQTATPAVPLSIAPGNYRFALVVDAHDDLSEPNEGNNVALSGATARIGPQQPDLQITSVRSSDPGALPNGQATVFVQLTNGGNLDATADWSLVLSRNEVISSDDLILYQGTVSLPLLTTQTATVGVTIPGDLSAGRYWFGAIADPENEVAELLEINNTGVADSTFEVHVGDVGIDTVALPRAYVGQDYSVFLTGTGGNGTYAWRVVSGTMPAGLSLLSTGEIRGRPTAIGQASLEIEVSSGGLTFTATLALEVLEVDGGLTIVTRQLLPGIVGASYPPAPQGTTNEQLPRLIAVGAQGDVTWTSPGPLPPGLALAADGLLHGLPTQRGVFDVTVSATDGTQTANRTMRLTVAQPGRLTLIAIDLPNGRIGEDYNVLLSVVGRTASSTVTYVSPNPLPPGLTLTTDGRIVGLPQQAGVWTFSVEVTENVADGGSDSAGFRIQVDADAGFGITPTTLPPATLGQSYSAKFEARQGRAPFTWRVIGPALPRGIIWEVVEVMGVSQLLFSGTPELEGAVSVLISLEDNDGRKAELPVTLLVNPVPAPPVVPMEPEGCQCRDVGGTSGGSSWMFLSLLLMIGVRSFSRPSRRRAE